MAITDKEGFSEQWEEAYAAGGHNSIWPWTDLVILVNRFARPSSFNSSRPAVLEIGCGAGANIPFLLSMGFDYHGIDGSNSAINRCRGRYPELESNLMVGDFSKSLGFDKKFSLIVDRASLTSNMQSSISDILVLIGKALSDQGKLVCGTLYSTEHPQFAKGEQFRSDEPFTRCNYPDGSFQGIGWVHFFDQAHIDEVFSRFRIEYLEHVVKSPYIGDTNNGTAFWNLVASQKS
jgi:SAM-dependent methyltransferase